MGFNEGQLRQTMSHDDNLLKFEIPEIIYGLGALEKIGQCAKRLGGERVLLVTDPGLVAAGWVDETLKYLENEDLSCFVYDNVVINPRDFQVEQGVQHYLQKQCDVIVGLGGGSPLDTAKGIAILVSNYGKIQDYEGCNLVTQPIPPLICVPTTAGSGADVTQFAIITDTKRKTKMTILSRAIMPDLSLIDPRLLQTKSYELMASTGMDTLTHAIEAYVSSLSWSLTDPHALHAIELVMQHLPEAAESKDLEALQGMSIACLEAGMAFSNAILGAVHALSHPLGGFYDIQQGLVNAVLLPVVVKKNLKYAMEKYAQVARVMGINTEKLTPEEAVGTIPGKIEELIEKLGLPRKLSQFGVKREHIPALAELAQEDLCLLTNPYRYSREEIELLYQEAW